MGFVPDDLQKLRPRNTMGHKTRTRWGTRQEHGTTSYTSATAYTRSYDRSTYAPKGNAPEFNLPIKRIKRTAGILSILFLLWILLYGLKLFP